MMNSNASKTANVLGGRTAKACDSCLCKRARWFCAADEAFLCQSCDNKVHLANQLASRHERVRIGTDSSKGIDKKGDESSAPAWHHGFTRKARTPRYGKKTIHKKESDAIFDHLPLVPEIGYDETKLEENDEQLLFCVPIFDTFDAVCSVPSDMDALQGTEGDDIIIGNELESLLYNYDETCDMEIPELLGSEMELADFAADVESMLGTGLDEVIDPCGDDQEANILDVFIERSKVKMEDVDEEVKNAIACHLDRALDMEPGESLNWDINYEMGEQEELKIVDQITKTPTTTSNSGNQIGVECKRKRLLILNYDAVITAWNNQVSPWADGVRPKFNPDYCWSDFLDTREKGLTYGNFGVKGRGGGREARVSRYRDKRRTRLYSRKIRYEVRKLNAEKRPRMKGRFVKRTNILGTSNLPPYMINNLS